MPKFLTRHRLGIVAITVAWIIWGAHPIAAKFGLQTFPIYSLIFYRLFLSTLILLPFLIKEFRKTNVTYPELKQLVVAALLGITFNIIFYFLGIERTGAIDSSLITATAPILTMIFASTFLKEKISKHELFGVILGITGTVLIFTRPLIESGGFSRNFLGNIFITLAMLTWVAFTIYSKKLTKKFSPMFIASSSIFIGMITLLPLMVLEAFKYPNWINSLTPNSFYSMLYMILGTTIGAYFLYEWGLKYVKVSLAGIISNIHLVVTIILGVLILNERLSLMILGGTILIMFGVIYSSINDSVYHKHPHHHRHKI